MEGDGSSAAAAAAALLATAAPSIHAPVSGHRGPLQMAAEEAALLWTHAGLLGALICVFAVHKVRHAGLIGVEGLSAEEASALSAFQRRYLAPYLLATFSDWIQGPYQFKVYLTYGLSEGQIGVLYIAGFGSSLFLGTWAAAAADGWGRRAGCLLYCVTCALSCLTKNSPFFHVLLIGRLLGGVAASLLFATFEAWCTTAAHDAQLPPRLLGAVFANAGFLNGVVAIVASLAGHALVVLCDGSFVAPFNAVPLVLAACAALMLRTWDENYGSRAGGGAGDGRGVCGGVAGGVRAISAEPSLVLLGLLGSLFDAALYIFIFLWTLGLERRSAEPEALPHGVAFAVFMGWCMAGALACEALLGAEMCALRGGTGARAAGITGVTLWIAVAGLSAPIPAGTSFAVVFCGFCAFEFCAGAYQPAVALLRALHLREEGRAAATALFRMPTNLAVCVVLLKTEELTEATKFGLCVLLLLCAAAAHALFVAKAPPKLPPGATATPRGGAVCSIQPGVGNGRTWKERAVAIGQEEAPPPHREGSPLSSRVPSPAPAAMEKRLSAARAPLGSLAGAVPRLPLQAT